MKKGAVIGLVLGIIFICLAGIAGIAVVTMAEKPEVYEGNYMKFEYDSSLQLSSREQENCTNVTVSDEEGNVVVCSVVIELEDGDKDLFFESVEKTLNGRKEMEIVEKTRGKSNDGEGRKYYREYEVLDIDNNEYKALAQVQKLEDDMYIFTLAYIEEDFEETERLAKITMDSVTYSDVEDAGDLELTEHFEALFEIHSFLIFNVDEDTSIDTEDLDRALEEHKEKIPADLTLKEVEDYEYLMQIDIASADGNIYQVMVPKEYDPEGEKRFITHLDDDGFMLSMYARELFDEETLVDFLEVGNDFIYEDPEKGYINVEKTEIIEENGLVYQICIAERVDHKNQIVKYIELVAAIPLGGTDTLSFSLSFSGKSIDGESREYLEELERYYGVPVTEFPYMFD